MLLSEAIRNKKIAIFSGIGFAILFGFPQAFSSAKNEAFFIFISGAVYNILAYYWVVEDSRIRPEEERISRSKLTVILYFPIIIWYFVKTRKGKSPFSILKLMGLGILLNILESIVPIIFMYFG